METHKKLIKPTPLLPIKSCPKNLEKPNQTHTTIADQTQHWKPKNTRSNPHHHRRLSQKYPTPRKPRTTRLNPHSHRRSSQKYPAPRKPKKTQSNPLHHCRSNPHHHLQSNDKERERVGFRERERECVCVCEGSRA